MAKAKTYVYNGGIPEDVELRFSKKFDVMHIKMEIRIRSNMTRKYYFKSKDAKELSRNIARFICINSNRMTQNSYKRLMFIDSVREEVMQYILNESVTSDEKRINT